MEKVPQIVSERLVWVSVPANHPGADLLAAFSERALSGAERAFVMQHLANCTECRDVVALALPPADEVEAVTQPSTAAWLAWPILRWGAVAAGVVLVGSFGLIEYQHRHEARTNLAYTSSESLDKEAKNAAPPLPSQTPEQNKAKDISPKEIPPTSIGIAAGAVKSEAPSPSAPALVRVNPPTANLQHGPRVQFQQNATFQQAPGSLSAPARVQVGGAAGNLPVPAPSEAVQVAAAPPAAENETANLDAGLAPLASQSGTKQLDSRVERSKPARASVSTTAQASAAQAEKVMAAPAARNLARAVAVNSVSVVTWSISSSGALQRSFDQGGTWQNVDVSARADAGFQSFHGAAKQTATDALKKNAQVLVFRAVTANEADVWAGASGGLLYHSTDAGEHWTRVVPSSLGSSLSGDIVSLEFPDPQHGRVVTATPEVWTTADSGQSWQKQ